MESYIGEALPNWKPSIALKQGIKEIIQHYQS
jgi:hypothetical protein